MYGCMDVCVFTFPAPEQPVRYYSYSAFKSSAFLHFSLVTLNIPAPKAGALQMGPQEIRLLEKGIINFIKLQ
jgi:hypothetical protein